MSMKKRELYSSANGDAWYLCRENGDVFVEHQPNLASGGQTSRTPIATFLARGPLGPEHQELIRLIGTLADQAGQDTAIRTA
jgi:hypothetical protein